MKRGFLNKTKPKGSPTHSASTSSSNNQIANTTSKNDTQIAVGEVKNGGEIKKSIQPKTEDTARKPELNNLTFVTIPPRRPNEPDDPDGHTELVVPTYGNALDKILKTPGYPKPIPKTPHKNYIIKPVEGMGLGMFATRKLQKCDLVFAERAFFCTPLKVISKGIFDADVINNQLTMTISLSRGLAEKRLTYMLSRMSNADQEAVMQLANCRDEDADDTEPLHGRYLTNAYSTSKISDDVPENIRLTQGGPSKTEYSLLAKDSSRINHSCIPNVLQRFDLASFSIQFFARKTINPGDQIFSVYCGIAGERGLLIKRRAALSRYGIVCTCYACTNSSPESEALRTEFPNRIRNLTKACDDLIGGLIVVGPDGKVPRHLSPDKPFNEAIQGGKLKKEVLEPALRLLADLEKEGLDLSGPMDALWAVLATAWRRLSGPYAAMKSLEAYKQGWAVLDLYEDPLGDIVK